MNMSYDYTRILGVPPEYIEYNNEIKLTRYNDLHIIQP